MLGIEPSPGIPSRAPKGVITANAPLQLTPQKHKDVEFFMKERKTVGGFDTVRAKEMEALGIEPNPGSP